MKYLAKFILILIPFAWALMILLSLNGGFSTDITQGMEWGIIIKGIIVTPFAAGWAVYILRKEKLKELSDINYHTNESLLISWKPIPQAREYIVSIISRPKPQENYITLNTAKTSDSKVLSPPLEPGEYIAQIKAFDINEHLINIENRPFAVFE